MKTKNADNRAQILKHRNTNITATLARLRWISRFVDRKIWLENLPTRESVVIFNHIIEAFQFAHQPKLKNRSLTLEGERLINPR